MEKKGIKSLGYVSNLALNSNNVNYITVLSKMAGKEISPEMINDFIEGPDFSISYFDKDGNNVEKEQAFSFTFKTPFKTTYNECIYGEFSRDSLDKDFVGVWWKYKKSLRRVGNISNDSVSELIKISNGKAPESIDINMIVDGDIEYLNGAGYSHLKGKTVDSSTAKFVRFKTIYESSKGHPIYGWFTKKRKNEEFHGLNWGTLDDFEIARQERENFFVGRMEFDSLDECNSFLIKLKGEIIEEEWTYQNKDTSFEFPILKSYLEFELDRLFYESEHLKLEKKIIYNRDGSKMIFNTNLIDNFGHDLFILGDVVKIGGKNNISNLKIRPSITDLKRLGFEEHRPIPPMFFSNINEIIFHWQWEVDKSAERYEHIIKDRINRFPEKYRKLSTNELGQKLDVAITLAQSIAQRNYKFIVPMYYPEEKRIQLLMPIYLEHCYSRKPDFALILTPNVDVETYTLETILGLDEVYQDARLIAKPEESWLSPELISHTETNI